MSVKSSSDALETRLNFIDFGAKARSDISAIRPILLKELPGALGSFYVKVKATPQTRGFFSSEAQIAGAQSRQLAHWDAISQGRFDADYVKAVTQVGEVHARIGLEPRWYIGGYALLLETLVAKVVEARWPKGGLNFGGARSGAAQKLSGELGALIKATLLDMDFAISVYLEALERAREEADAKRRLGEEAQARIVSLLADRLNRIASGDLTARIDEAVDGAYEVIRTDFNKAVSALNEALGGVSDATDSLNVSAGEIGEASNDLSRRTEQQAASLEETAAALDQITATVRRSADGARSASKVVGSARAEAAASAQVMGDAVAAMSEIEGAAHQISQIIGVIDEIAFQTNLLALNAGVEAARAGESGRGFAVVATEVRALAQRSADAAREIKTLIASSASQVERGVKLVNETGSALGAIVVKVGEIDQLISEMYLSSGEQSTGLEGVNTAINQMDQITQQNAAMVEETTAAVGNMRAAAGELQERLSGFVLEGRSASGRTQSASAARRAPPRRAAASGGPAGGSWEEF